MRKIELDIRSIQTVKALHIYLQYMLDLPAYYGRNLDALYDVLCDESGETAITLLGPASAGSELEAYLPRLTEVFCDSAQDNGRISFRVESMRQA